MMASFWGPFLSFSHARSTKKTIQERRGTTWVMTYTNSSRDDMIVQQEITADWTPNSARSRLPGCSIVHLNTRTGSFPMYVLCTYIYNII